MATKTFKQEIFAPQKLTKYQQALADYHKGTPVMVHCGDLAIGSRQG